MQLQYFSVNLKYVCSFRVKPSIPRWNGNCWSISDKIPEEESQSIPPSFYFSLCTSDSTTVEGSYHIKWSEEGSNDRAEEEDTIYCSEHSLGQVILD